MTDYRESVGERSEVMSSGRCQVCGQLGPTVLLPTSPPPNQLCPRCAIEYGGSVEQDEE
jgi:hypothetical protein